MIYPVMNAFGQRPMQQATMTALAYPMMMQGMGKKKRPGGVGGANNMFSMASLGASPAAPVGVGMMRGGGM